MIYLFLFSLNLVYCRNSKISGIFDWDQQIEDKFCNSSKLYFDYQQRKLLDEKQSRKESSSFLAKLKVLDYTRLN